MGAPPTRLLSSISGASSKFLVTLPFGIFAQHLVKSLPWYQNPEISALSHALMKQKKKLFKKISSEILGYLQRYFFLFGTEWQKLPFPHFPRFQSDRQKRRTEENETVNGKRHFVLFVDFGKILQSVRPGLNVAFYMRRIELPN